MLKKIITIVTLALVAVAIYLVREDIWAAINGFDRLNPWVLVLLIPQQLGMYAGAGQIYFSFLKHKLRRRLSLWTMTRVSMEINFVNHILPSGGVSGMGYLAWRLKEWKITAGQATFAHVLRVGVTAAINVGQMAVALLIIWALGTTAPGQEWVLMLGALACVGFMGAVVFVFWLITSKKRIAWFSMVTSKIANGLVRKLTRGKRRKVLDEAKVDAYFMDLHDDWLMVRRNKKLLLGPFKWAVVYNAFELMTYYIVSCAMGHPELLPQIALAEGIAGFVGAVMVTPGGVGGYEGAMIGIMAATSGVNIGDVTLIVIVTRVAVLMMTIVSGWGLYQQALSSRRDKYKPVEGEA
jgi:uncharacterized protein (TIRG00374 family)